MIITPINIEKLEHTYRMYFSKGFKRYLLAKYGEEPFPYEFSEQDLYENIRHDIHDYEKLISLAEIVKIKTLPKAERDELISRIKKIKYLSQRQAARILGISSLITNYFNKK